MSGYARCQVCGFAGTAGHLCTGAPKGYLNAHEQALGERNEARAERDQLKADLNRLLDTVEEHREDKLKAARGIVTGKFTPDAVLYTEAKRLREELEK